MDSLFRTLQKTNNMAAAIWSCVWIETNHIPALLSQLAKTGFRSVAIYRGFEFPLRDMTLGGSDYVVRLSCLARLRLGELLRGGTTGQKQSAGRE